MNSLGFDKPPAETRVVVAMSGGVDSSVTAALLREQGYDVVGITLQLYDHGMAVARKGACCAGQDIYDARRVAERIGIPHYVLDYENAFKQSVIDDFADSYLRGETPIPCVKCNQSVKFRDLLATARELGAEALATGHYVQRVMGEAGPELHAATDATRDQSYFLFATTRDQLGFLRFPLGGMPKSEVRALAERFDLPVAAKPDSQDICFVPNGDYASVVGKLRPGAIDPGEIVDMQGNVLGRHEGIINFTVGQRRGLDIHDRAGESNEPLYVLRLDAARKRVIVGPREALGQTEIHLRDLNWLGAPVPEGGARVQVRLRSTQPPAAATIAARGDTGAVITLDEPVMGVAPGQAGVIYQGARVLGGGWIAAANEYRLTA
ncbi:MAG: tRNA 2-thiouridine(34) synthase MnmA [Alphaproteobacteria bacterium]|nr:tRNA 2-thiouridine(34) synthase MnmA [Alphaproteobacteria bacterium]